MTASTQTKSGKPRRRPQAAPGKPLEAAEGSRLTQRWMAARSLSKSIIEALNDPDLFGGLFGAPSWEPWRAFLEALQGLPMSDAHLTLYKHHTGRSEPPAKPARYAELVVGRRGGKSRILALIATYLACVLDLTTSCLARRRLWLSLRGIVPKPK
jgi:hypothetical protein